MRSVETPLYGERGLVAGPGRLVYASATESATAWPGVVLAERVAWNWSVLVAPGARSAKVAAIVPPPSVRVAGACPAVFNSELLT